MILAGAAGAITLAALTGCASEGRYPNSSEQGADGNDDDIYTTTVHLPDGRSVLCVEYAGYKQGGISCDWANAK